MKPLVGISCCSKSFGPNGLPNHAASDFVVRAICLAADAVPVLLPACGSDVDAHCLLARLDGILLTGSRSNVAPRHYGCDSLDEAMATDHRRDATTLPLVRAAVGRGMPMLAICRGMQEINVALGGTLHQDLKRLDGRLNHAAAEPEDELGRIRPAHGVSLMPGGLLQRLLNTSTIAVNSLHQQAIDELAPGLAVEAVAPDGTIEAVRLCRNSSFGLGVQWHPEFDAGSNPVSVAVFRAFGRALRRVGSDAKLAADEQKKASFLKKRTKKLLCP